MYRYTTTPDLVEACLDGDEQAWRDLVYRFTPLVWSIARAHRLSTADCEDVGQATWMRLWRSLNGLRDPERLAEYLAMITRRESLRHLDIVARQRTGPIPDRGVSADTEPSAEAVLVTRERQEELARALLQLPVRCQHMIALLVDQRSYAEIAAALDLSTGSVGPIRRRCLEHLRALIQANRQRAESDSFGMRLDAVR